MKKVLMSLFIVIMIIGCGSDGNKNKGGTEATDNPSVITNSNEYQRGDSILFYHYIDMKKISLVDLKKYQEDNGDTNVRVKELESKQAKTCESFGFTFDFRGNVDGNQSTFYKNEDDKYCIVREHRSAKFGGYDVAVSFYRDNSKKIKYGSGYITGDNINIELNINLDLTAGLKLYQGNTHTTNVRGKELESETCRGFGFTTLVAKVDSNVDDRPTGSQFINKYKLTCMERDWKNTTHKGSNNLFILHKQKK